MDALKDVIDYGVICLLLVLSVWSVAVAIERWLFYKRINLSQFSNAQLLEITLTKRLVVIGTVAANAPYIGLLGTVLGIMLTFHTMGTSGTMAVNTIMIGLSLASNFQEQFTYSLDNVMRLCGIDITAHEKEIKQFLGRKYKDYGLIPPDKMAVYAAVDVLSVRYLHHYLPTITAAKEVVQLESELLPTLIMMEKIGVKTDLQKIKDDYEFIKPLQEARINTIKKLSEYPEFDPSKKASLRELFLERMGLILDSTEKGATSFAESSILKHRSHHKEIIDAYLAFTGDFEELFTLCRAESERQAFINNLLIAATEPGGKTFVILALRADFYASCAAYDALRAALASQQEFIGPMSAAELRQSIQEPARHGGWELEAGLVDLILQDVGLDGDHSPEPGALPLVSHAMLETFHRRRSRTLTISGYLASGGVRGAIGETPDIVFNDQLDAAQQVLARQIFQRLTQIGEDGRIQRHQAG